MFYLLRKINQSYGILGLNFHLSFIQCHLCAKPCVSQGCQQNSYEDGYVLSALSKYRSD